MVSDNHRGCRGENSLGRLIHGKRQNENDVIDRGVSEMGGRLAQRAPGFRTPHFQGGGGAGVSRQHKFFQRVKGFQCFLFFFCLPFFSLFKKL